MSERFEEAISTLAWYVPAIAAFITLLWAISTDMQWIMKPDFGPISIGWHILIAITVSAAIWFFVFLGILCLGGIILYGYEFLENIARLYNFAKISA